MISINEKLGNVWRSLKEKDDVSRSIPFLCKSVIIILIIGLAIRILLGFFMTHDYDMYHWGIIIENIDSGNGLYEITGYFYTPPWGYMLGVVSLFQDLIGIDVIGERITAALPIEEYAWFFTGTVTTPAFNITVKMLFFICDIFVGYLIFTLIRDRTNDQRKATIGFALWFMCPFVITVGAVGGMFDTISTLMTVLSVIFLLKGRYIESGIMLSMATMTKFFPGFLVFIFIAYILIKHKDDGLAIKKAAYFVVAAGITALLILLPQILDGTLADCFLFITSRVDSGLGGGWGLLERYGIMAVYAISLILSALAGFYIYKGGKEKLDGRFLMMVLVVIAVIFVYPPLPQYVLLIAPFLILAAVNNKRYIIPWILLSIGTGLYAITAGPIDLLSVAAFTDLIDINSLMSTIEQYSPAMSVIYSFCRIIQFMGIISIIWIRFGDDIKRIMNKHTKKHSSEQKLA